MKCIVCDHKVKEGKIVEYEEFGISLGKFEAMVCPHCGETYFDSGIVKKIQKRSKELGLFGLAAKKTKVAQIGNSLAIRIPKEIAEFTNLKKEREVRIIPKGKKEITFEIM